MKEWFIKKILSWLFNSETGQKLKASAAKKINERLDIPHLTEDQENKLIVAILDAAWEAGADWLSKEAEKEEDPEHEELLRFFSTRSIANIEPEE